MKVYYFFFLFSPSRRLYKPHLKIVGGMQMILRLIATEIPLYYNIRALGNIIIILLQTDRPADLTVLPRNNLIFHNLRTHIIMYTFLRLHAVLRNTFECIYIYILKRAPHEVNRRHAFLSNPETYQTKKYVLLYK